MVKANRLKALVLSYFTKRALKAPIRLVSSAGSLLAMAAVLVAILTCMFYEGLLSLESVCFGCGESDTESECPLLNGPCSGDWISFRLYDRYHPWYGQSVVVTSSWNNLTEAGYHAGLSTAVLIHGFADSIKLYSLVRIKNELLKNYNMFVLFLDWAKAVPDGCYVASVYNVRYAGRCLADLVNALGRPQSGLHVIGFSLGAHVPASAATFLAPYKIPRITGLDPALPLFWGLVSQWRLKKSDGLFVDVIHTNAFIQGHMMPLGHADFYVNGGTFQPGCGDSFKAIISCSHERAPVYYAESINTKLGFWGCKSSYLNILGSCDPKEVTHLMGYHVDPNLIGIVILKTASHSPFALGKPKVESPQNESSSLEDFNPSVIQLK